MIRMVCAPFIAALSAAMLLTGCLGPHKINKWVAHHYSDDAVQPAKRKSEQIVVSSKLPDMGTQLSETQKNVSHLLPLILYIQFDYRNTCTINPQIPVNNFMAAVNNYSGRGLRQKLNGNRLELTIEQLPHSFVVDDKGKMYLLLIGFEWISVLPEPQNMVVSYRVLDNSNAEIKKGTITIADPDKGLPLGMFQSLKKKTWEYLDQYDANVTTMTRKMVDQLVTEL